MKSTSPTRTCLLVNNSPEPGRGELAKLGGGGHSLLGLVETLARFGWKIHVVVPADGPLTAELRQRGIPHTVFPFRDPGWRHPLAAAQDFLRWRRIIRKIRPDIIHSNAFLLHRVFALAAASCRVPFVSHVHFPADAPAIRWSCRFLPKPRGYIFVSRPLRDAVWPALCRYCAGARDFIVHNAVNTDTFTLAPWPEDAPIRIGIIGNLVPIKRHADFLRMAAEIRQTGLQAEFWVIGADTEGRGHGEKIFRLAAELGLGLDVHFMGHRSDVAALISQLHLLVLTSEYESFGRVLIEAMARGRPVLATRTGGIPEVVRDGETGYLFDVGDYHGMAQAALALLADRPRWERMSQAAAVDARTRFSLDQHTRQIIDVYEQTITKKVRPPRMRTCLLVNNSPEPGRGERAKLGGGGHSLLGLVQALPELGWQCHVVVPADGPLTQELRNRCIPHTIFPYEDPDWRHPLRAARQFFHWLKIIRATRADLIHANAFDLHRAFVLPATAAGIPVIAHSRFPMDEAGIRWLCRGLPRPKGFIFTSQALHDAVWGAIERRCRGALGFVVHNAVNLATFTPAPWPDAATPRIGIIGNLLPVKRHEDFLRMAAELVQQGFSAEFWIVGADTEGKGQEEKLRDLCESLGLANHVEFLGHRADIPNIMRQLHLVILTSEYESFGRTLIEAMACGRPVIATRTGGIPEVVREGETGYLFEVGDYKGMAIAARALLEDRAHWEQISQAVLMDVRARFSLPQHASHIVDVYNTVLNIEGHD